MMVFGNGKRMQISNKHNIPLPGIPESHPPITQNEVATAFSHHKNMQIDIHTIPHWCAHTERTTASGLDVQKLIYRLHHVGHTPYGSIWRMNTFL